MLQHFCTIHCCGDDIKCKYCLWLQACICSDVFITMHLVFKLVVKHVVHTMLACANTAGTVTERPDDTQDDANMQGGVTSRARVQSCHASMAPGGGPSFQCLCDMVNAIHQPPNIIAGKHLFLCSTAIVELQPTFYHWSRATCTPRLWWSHRHVHDHKQLMGKNGCVFHFCLVA